MRDKDLAYPDISTTVRFEDIGLHFKDWYIEFVGSAINTVGKFNQTLAGRMALKVWGKTRMKRFTPRGVFSFSKPEFVKVGNKDIAFYEFGKENSKKILLTHGWEGQASDFYRMIPVLVDNGFHVVTFDGPAHGQSMGTHSHLFEFVETIEIISKLFNGFDYAIGHSMGGAATVVANYLSMNFKPKKIIPMGAPNKLETMVKVFADFVKLDKYVFHSIIDEIEKITSLKVKDISLENYLKDVDSKIMIVHCEDDNMVPYKRVEEILEKVEVDKLLKTQELGHVKILRDANVIQEVTEFLKN